MIKITVGKKDDGTCCECLVEEGTMLHFALKQMKLKIPIEYYALVDTKTEDVYMSATTMYSDATIEAVPWVDFVCD